MSSILEYLIGKDIEYSNRRGTRFKEELLKKYPDGIVGTIGEPYMVRMKCWDSENKKYNRSWNIVAWRNDEGYPHTIKNELLWRIFLVFPIRWTQRFQFQWLDDVYEVVYQCKLYDKGGKEYPFVLSLFPEEVKNYAGAKVRIKKFGCVAHRFHKYLIGSDFEVYPQVIEVMK